MARDRLPNQSEQSSSRRYWCKVFKTRHDIVGAFCDEEILGRTLEDDRFRVKVSSGFYGGVLVGERVALKVMEKISIGNLMGKNIVEAAIEAGFITRENLIFIDGIPHAQFARLNQG